MDVDKVKSTWVEQDSERVKPSAFIVQFLATFAISYLTGLTGFIYAWPSYNQANFNSNETVLSRPLTPGEYSLLGSLANIGALVATPFCGYAVNTLGRKYSSVLFGVPSVLAWTIISLTNYVPLVIAAIGLAGFGAAGQVASSVYIAEIAQDSIRGGLTSSCVSVYFLGLLFSYIIGGHLTYHQVVYVHLSGSVLYMAMIMLLKESPVFLMQKGKEEEAAGSIAFYRRVSVTSKEVEVALNKIKLQLDPQIVEILAGDDDAEASKELIDNKTVPSVEVKPPESSWKFLMKSESSKRALGCSLFLMAAIIMMGAIVLQVYAEPLFKEAVPSMDSNLCSILLAIDLMVPSLICAVSVDRFGRKFLMTWTSVGSGLFTLLLASQLHLGYGPHWFTAFLIYAYCFIYNLGAATVPFIFAAEIFLPEVRGLCNSFVMACMWLTNFVTLIIFNPLVDNYGLGPLFYGFTVMCFLTAAYSHFFLPETKGLSADAIQLLFLKEKKTKNRS